MFYIIKLRFLTLLSSFKFLPPSNRLLSRSFTARMTKPNVTAELVLAAKDASTRCVFRRFADQLGCDQIAEVEGLEQLIQAEKWCAGCLGFYKVAWLFVWVSLICWLMVVVGCFVSTFTHALPNRAVGQGSYQNFSCFYIIFNKK